MTKFLLGVCIVAFTSFCGYFFAKKYAKRKLFLEQLKEFNDRFINEIGYYKRPLGEFISKYSQWLHPPLLRLNPRAGQFWLTVPLTR